MSDLSDKSELSDQSCKTPNTMEKKIVTFGEIMLRLSKPGMQRLMQGRAFEGNYGGSEANCAVALACLGDRVEYVTRVPKGPTGDAALMHLREYGLDVSHVVRGGDRLGTYYFEEAVAMRNSRVVYDRKDSSFYSLKKDTLDWAAILKDAKLFHCSGITCAISNDAKDTTMDAVRLADKQGLTIACDINYRKNLWHYDGADAHATLSQMVAQSDIVFGDQGEWEVASGMKRVPFEATDASYAIDLKAFEDYFRKLHAMFPRCKKMILALRNQLASSHHTLTGLLYDAEEGRLYHTRIYDIQPVIDPMGVGDAFVGAYLHAYYRWPDDNQHCLDFSLSASALKNTVPGDQLLVTEEEVESNITSSGGRIQR